MDTSAAISNFLMNTIYVSRISSCLITKSVGSRRWRWSGCSRRRIFWQKMRYVPQAGANQNDCDLIRKYSILISYVDRLAVQSNEKLTNNRHVSNLYMYASEMPNRLRNRPIASCNNNSVNKKKKSSSPPKKRNVHNFHVFLVFCKLHLTKLCLTGWKIILHWN